MAAEQDTGAVDRATVLEVLDCHGVTIGKDPEFEGYTILQRGEKIDARKMPEWCHRDLLQYLRRTFGVPMAHFYHPDWARALKAKRSKK